MNFYSNASVVTFSLVTVFFISGCAQLNTAANGTIDALAKGVDSLSPKDANNTISDKFSCDEYIAGKVLGTGIGIGTGALAGYYIGGEKGAYLGGAIGAGAGYLVGSTVDDRRRELCKLAKETKTKILLGNIKAEDIDGGISSEVEADVAAFPDIQFKSGSAELTVEQTAILKKFAQIYAKTEKNGKILIIGNTDDAGNEAQNQELSEARAKTIATVLKSQGVSENNLYYQGAGASMPIASNDSKEGQNLNRRVEVAVFKSEEKLVQAVQSRTPNPEFFSKKSSYAKENDQKPIQNKAAEKKFSENKNVKPKVKSADIKVAQTSLEKSAFSTEIDFGENNSISAPLGVKIGSPKKAVSWLDTFSFSTPAHAAEENWNYRKSCKDDFTKPEYSASSIKKLKDDGQVKYSTGNYYNGLYNTAWIADDVNGHFISMMPMAILKEGAKPVGIPEMKIWKDYDTNKKDKPDFSVQNNVNTCIGDKGLLLRFYPSSENDSIVCSDMFVSADGKSGLQQIYYRKDGKIYMREVQTKKVTQ